MDVYRVSRRGLRGRQTNRRRKNVKRSDRRRRTSKRRTKRVNRRQTKRSIRQTKRSRRTKRVNRRKSRRVMRGGTYVVGDLVYSDKANNIHTAAGGRGTGTTVAGEKYTLEQIHKQVNGVKYLKLKLNDAVIGYVKASSWKKFDAPESDPEEGLNIDDIKLDL